MLGAVLNEDAGTTGNFEIRLNGQLIHSKKTIPGHGKCEKPEEREAVFTAVRQLLQSKGVEVPPPNAAAKARAESDAPGGCLLL